MRKASACLPASETFYRVLLLMCIWRYCENLGEDGHGNYGANLLSANSRKSSVIDFTGWFNGLFKIRDFCLKTFVCIFWGNTVLRV